MVSEALTHQLITSPVVGPIPKLGERCDVNSMVAMPWGRASPEVTIDAFLNRYGSTILRVHYIEFFEYIVA